MGFKLGEYEQLGSEENKSSVKNFS